MVQIKIPDGASGMQPALALSYNSNRGDGIAGRGWHLSGFPGVTRDRAFTLCYNRNDRFIGPNGRLVKVDEYYHHEEENYSRFKAVDETAAGPGSWIETRPDGTRLFYGSAENSRSYAADRPGAVRLWALDAVEDLHGNLYRIEYIHDRGQCYPSRVIYTLGSGISRYRAVDLEYEDRPDAAISYEQHTSVVTALRLKRITVTSGIVDIFGVTLGGDMVREYHLEYEDGGPVPESRLVRVRETGAEGGELPPLEFEYDHAGDPVAFKASSFVPWDRYNTSVGTWLGGDINGDGRPDLFHVVSPLLGAKHVNAHISNGDGTFSAPAREYVPWKGYDTASGEWQSGDFNGDGRTDFFHIVRPFLLNAYVNIWASNGDGTFEVTRFDPVKGYPASRGRWVCADVNGDGRTDMVHLYPEGGTACMFHFNTWLADGEGGFSMTAFDLRYSGIPDIALRLLFASSSSVQHAVPLQACDMNGDGRDDFTMVWFGETPLLPEVMVYTLISNGDGTFRTAGFRPPDGSNIDRIALNTMGRYGVQLLTGDYNGDGLADLLLGSLRKDRSYLLLSRGDGTYDARSASSDGAGYDRGTWENADVNGDGMFDVIHAVKSGLNGHVIYTWLSRGDGGFSVQSHTLSSEYPVADGRIIAGDFTGDGRCDLAHIRTTAGKNRINVLTAGPSGTGLINCLRDGMGGTVGIEYTPACGVPGAVRPEGLSYPYVANTGFRHLVTGTTAQDGRGAAYKTGYEYSCGMVYAGARPERKDLLFESFAVLTGPASSPERAVTRFVQNDHLLHGSPLCAEQYARDGSLVKRVDYTYYEDPATRFGTMRALQKSVRQVNFDHGHEVTVGVKEYCYDDYGNVIRTEDYAQGTETVVVTNTYAIDESAWDLRRLAETVTAANGTETQRQKFMYAGNDCSEVQTYYATGGRWLSVAYGHDENGNRIMTRDTLGRATCIEYDGQYRAYPVRSIDAMGRAVTAEFDHRFGTKISETDLNGNTTRYEHDQFGRAVRAIESGDEWTVATVYHFTGDASTQYVETRVRDRSGEGFHYKRRYFDGMGRDYRTVQKAHRSDGAQYDQAVEVEYDESGRKIRESLPHLVGTYDEPVNYITYTYDALNRLSCVEYPDGYKKQTSYYDLGGGKYAESVRDSVHPGREYAVIRDARGRVVEKLEPNNVRIAYGYDSAGLLTSLVNTDGLETRICYDSLGRKTSITDPDTGISSYAYDDAGRLSWSRDARGSIVRYEYDGLDRIVRIDHPDDTPDVTYEYDDPAVANGIGRVSRIDDGVSVSSFAYDAKGRAAVKAQAIDGRTFVFRMDYDEAGRVTRLTYPDGTAVEREYSDAGGLKALRWDGHAVVSYGRFRDGEEAGIENKLYRLTGEGIESEIEYDPKTGRPVRIVSRRERGAGEPVEDVEYRYGGSGSVEAIVDNLDPSKSQAFSYDALDRVTSADGVYGHAEYRYLNNGNILIKEGLRLQYDPDHPHAVSWDSEGNRYEYDANGNMVRRGGSDLAYDAVNRLVSISRDGVETAAYAYDHANNRVRRSVAGGAVSYNADRLYEVTVAPGGGERHTKYFYGIKNELVAQMTRENASLVALDDPRIIGAYYAKDTLNGLCGYACGLLGSLSRDPDTYRCCAAALLLMALTALLGFFVTSCRARPRRRPGAPLWATMTAPAVCFCVFAVFGLFGCVDFLDTGSDGEPPWAAVLAGGDGGAEGPARGMYFFHPDHNGNISYIADDRGEVVCRLHYRPYGETASMTGVDPARYKFNTHELDAESGLYYCNARYYDPGIGRFITPDTIVPDPGRSQTLNRYMYVEGNPVSLNDPTGTRATWQLDLYAEYQMALWQRTTGKQPFQGNFLADMVNSLIDSLTGIISLVNGGGFGFLAHWMNTFKIFDISLSYSYKDGWGLSKEISFGGKSSFINGSIGLHWQQRGPNGGLSVYGSVSFNYKNLSIGLTTSYNLNKHTVAYSLRLSISGEKGAIGIGYNWLTDGRNGKLLHHGISGYAGINLRALIGNIPTSSITVFGEKGIPLGKILTRYMPIKFLSPGDLPVFGFQESGHFLSEDSFGCQVLAALGLQPTAILHDSMVTMADWSKNNPMFWFSMPLCFFASTPVAISNNTYYQGYLSWLRGF
ncbi:MAG: VCBS repeat-containing protein [Spirochaetes bacterium]|nr:VCBS repeat-containing protein [Spirochaetota bacterium]